MTVTEEPIERVRIVTEPPKRIRFADFTAYWEKPAEFAEKAFAAEGSRVPLADKVALLASSYASQIAMESALYTASGVKPDDMVSIYLDREGFDAEGWSLNIKPDEYLSVLYRDGIALAAYYATYTGEHYNAGGYYQRGGYQWWGCCSNVPAAANPNSWLRVKIGPSEIAGQAVQIANS